MTKPIRTTSPNIPSRAKSNSPVEVIASHFQSFFQPCQDISKVAMANAELNDRYQNALDTHRNLVSNNDEVKTAYTIYSISEQKAQKTYREAVRNELEDGKYKNPDLQKNLISAYEQKSSTIKLAQNALDNTLSKFPEIKKSQDEIKAFHSMIVARDIRREKYN